MRRLELCLVVLVLDFTGDVGGELSHEIFKGLEGVFQVLNAANTARSSSCQASASPAARHWLMPGGPHRNVGGSRPQRMTDGREVGQAELRED